MLEQQVYYIPRLVTHCHGLLPDSAWQDIRPLDIQHAHPSSSEHRPRTCVRLLWQSDALHLRFDVDDQFVCCRHMQRQGPVCKDSCVEAFIQPAGSRGYFNFEINIAGVLHASYIQDHTRTSTGFKQWTPLDDTQLDSIMIRADRHDVIDSEMSESLTWRIICRIPRSAFEAYAGPVTFDGGACWRANFYKCADESSHPHWLSWQPVGQTLNFHQPQTFGEIYFK